MKPNKGLIIKKQWLDKIFHDGKIWEMRSTKTKIRGKIYLIESGSGLIFGEANLVHSEKIPDPDNKKYIEYHKIDDLSLLSKWDCAWVLSEIKKYEKPIPYKHPQGAVIWVNL